MSKIPEPLRFFQHLAVCPILRLIIVGKIFSCNREKSTPYFTRERICRRHEITVATMHAASTALRLPLI